MKRLIAATIAVALSAPAFAADLGGMKDNTTATTDYSTTAAPGWAGWYVGGHIGYGWGEFSGTRDVRRDYGQFTKAHCNDSGRSQAECTGTYTVDGNDVNRKWIERVDTPIVYDADSTSGTSDLDKVFGGIDLSYKIKVGQVIFEPFADVSWGGGKSTESFERDITSVQVLDQSGEYSPHDMTSANAIENGSISVEKNWDSTLGLKAGVLVTPTDYLYGLGGLKYGSFTMKGNSNVTSTVYPDEAKKYSAAYSSDEDAWGYTLGAGLEHAVNNHLHIGIEGRYTAYEDIKSGYSKSVDGTAGDIHTYATSDKLKGDYDEWSVLGRISYRLGGN